MGDEQKSLELKTRRIIYNHILKNPGLHERELSRQLELALSTLDYHLYYLKKRELVATKSDGHYTLYYASDKVGSKEKKMMSLLRQKAPRKIVIFLLINSSCTHKQICEYLGLAASTTSFHLKKLVKNEIIRRVEQGRETNFNVLEQDYISDLIITYKNSFLDDAVNRFADTWLELNPQSTRKKKEENH
jgi:predicted transcriptional regulator